MANVIVLGGGISGLSCAYYLSKLGKHVLNKVILLERSTVLGGWITSTRFPDGTVYEHGPKSVRVMGKPGFNTLSLAEDLDLASDILPVTAKHRAAGTRMILVDDKLHVLPNSFASLFKKQPPFSKSFGRVLFKEIITRKSNLKDESVHDFATRRFGQEVAELLFDPLCRGIVANNSRIISVKSLFKPFYEAEQKHGSVVLGQIKNMSNVAGLGSLLKSKLVEKAKLNHWTMWSLKNGLQSFTDALTDNLVDDDLVHIMTNVISDRILFSKEGASVHFEGELTTTKVDHVFSAIPAKRLSTLLSAQQPTLAKYLSLISAVNVAVVNLEYKGKVLKQEGFGFLSPSNQGSKVLGITFDSCSFPEHDGQYSNKTRITCMMGGHWFEEQFGSVNSVKEELILHHAVEAAVKHLGIKAEPFRHHVSIHRNCIPEYKVGHDELVNNMKNEIKSNNFPLTLLGASYSGVGLNDCIYNSRVAAENYIQSLE